MARSNRHHRQATAQQNKLAGYIMTTGGSDDGCMVRKTPTEVGSPDN